MYERVCVVSVCLYVYNYQCMWSMCIYVGVNQCVSGESMCLLPVGMCFCVCVYDECVRVDYVCS